MGLGFCIVPSLLLWAQERLKLNAAHLAIVVHLLDHWWHVDRLPFPSKRRLAERLSLSERQVQRRIGELERMGFVARIARTDPRRGKLTNAYDLSGLVRRLKELDTSRRHDAACRRRRGTAHRGRNPGGRTESRAPPGVFPSDVRARRGRRRSRGTGRTRGRRGSGPACSDPAA
ncbi:MAG TPA: helix-turn-helix domain-containing protein [Candidatus Binatia bacterium]|nr:helix-turn-helix domain-containing protein [Candidatus Binatia bacterium]